MPLRRLIMRLMLCVGLTLATSYAQAIAGRDDVGSTLQIEKAKLPPCHETASHGQSSGAGSHDKGCCSNFACAFGLTAQDAFRTYPGVDATYELDLGTTKRSDVQKPLNPPPKFI